MSAGPTFGGILFDAVTFRWAIFLVIIAELISLSMLISYLCMELCGSNPASPPPSLASDTDQVALLASSSTQPFTKCSQTVSFTSCLDTAHHWRVVVTFLQLSEHSFDDILNLLVHSHHLERNVAKRNPSQEHPGAKLTNDRRRVRDDNSDDRNEDEEIFGERWQELRCILGG